MCRPGPSGMSGDRLNPTFKDSLLARISAFKCTQIRFSPGLLRTFSTDELVIFEYVFRRLVRRTSALYRDMEPQTSYYLSSS